MKISKNHYTNPDKHVVVFVESAAFFTTTNQEIIEAVKKSKYYSLALETYICVKVTNSALRHCINLK